MVYGVVKNGKPCIKIHVGNGIYLTYNLKEYLTKLETNGSIIDKVVV